MHVVVVVSHRHLKIQGTRTCRTRAAGLQEIPSCLGTASIPTGGWSWRLRHTLEIHTDDQRSSKKNKLHILRPLQDTIERRHQFPTRRPCISSATQTYLRPPRNLISLTHTHTHTSARADMETPQHSKRHRKRDSDLLAEVPDPVIQLDSKQSSSAAGSDNLLSRVC